MSSPTIFRIASAARRLAPGPPSLRAHARPALRGFAPRVARSVSIEIASRGDRFRRERVLDQFGHDPLPGNQVDHRERVELHEPPAKPVLERRQRDRRPPSACRAARSARSRCPTPSARRRQPPAPRRFRPSTIANRLSAASTPARTADRRDAAPARTRTAPRAPLRESSAAAPTSVGRMRRDFTRPAARAARAIVGASGIEPEPRRNASRDACGCGQIDQRMADEFHRHAGVAVDRFLERENHEHAVGNRANRLDAGPDATPRSAG